MPEELRRTLARDLGKLLVELTDPAFVAGLSTAERHRLNTTLLAIDRARGTLVNVLLGEIAARLAANEASLKAGLKDVRSALASEKKVARVFAKVDTYLAGLAKLLGFVATAGA